MKGFYFFFLLLFFSASLWAQVPQERKCAAQTLHAQKLENDPIYQNRYNEIQRRTSEFQEQRKFSRSSLANTVREIPVYVHVIYDENIPEQNISNAQIESQIEVLNQDFRALNADVSDVPAEFEGLVSDYHLTFTLEGVSRKSSSVSEWAPIDDKMKSVSTGGVDPVTPETHLNIWVVNLSGTTLGYAQFPGGSMDTDGVVVAPNFFGSSGYDTNNDFYLSAPYDKGRTTTHEIGHYLNLYHIWGDGNCTVDDEVADTPLAKNSNGGCPAYPSKSCAENTEYTSDMFMNYMDYVNDACMFMFSEGQKARSYALFEPGGFRENLGVSCGLTAPVGLEVVERRTTSLSLIWDTVADASGYDVWANGIISNSTTNSFELTGLDKGTNYEIKVAARCVGGGSSEYSQILNVNTLGCYNSPLELSITTDDFGAETSWELSFNGTIVQTDSITYDNNTTYTETFDFGDGDYKFEIFDSADDGICCGEYGDGSYSLSDSDGAIIKSGGEFESSESVGFCVEEFESVDCENALVATEGNNNTVAAPAVFKFEATANKEYIISSIGFTDVNTDLSIYSNCNILLAENDDFEGSQSEIRVILESGQQIYIYWKDSHSTSGFDWSITGGKSTQSISFDDISEKLVNDKPFDLTANASSGLAVSYSSSDPEVATVSGNTVTILGAGETTITAIQEGNEEYLAAPVVQKALRVNKLDQTISITDIPDKVTTDPDFEVEATTSSGLPLTYEISGPASINGTTISLDEKIGEVLVTAIQSGNEEYDSTTASITFQVKEDPCLDFIVSDVMTTDVSCAGGQDGSIEVTVSGGVEPYTYSLNGSSAVENNIWEGLPEGEYTLKIVDDSSCVVTTTATIKSPTPLEIEVEITNSSSVNGNGSIDLTVSGGVGDYSYEWSNGADTSLIEDLEIGIYSVIVTDGNGCSLEDSFEVGGVTSTDSELKNGLMIYPNPVQNYLNIKHSDDINKLMIYDAIGKLVIEKEIKGNQSQIDVNYFPAGLYFVRLQNNLNYHRFVKK